MSTEAVGVKEKTGMRRSRVTERSVRITGSLAHNILSMWPESGFAPVVKGRQYDKKVLNQHTK